MVLYDGRYSHVPVGPGDRRCRQSKQLDNKVLDIDGFLTTETGEEMYL